jgi:hypothetical protein
VRATLDRERALARLAREDAEIARLEEAIRRADGTSTYGQRLELARVTARALEALTGTLALAVAESLRGVAVAVQSTEATGEPLVLDAVLLVERARCAALVEELRTLVRRHGGLLAIDWQGPRPPNSFVNVKLRLGRAE